MAVQMLIVPGTNPVLMYVARQLEGTPQVQVVSSANAALWQVRRSAPRVIVADTQLKDIRGADLIEILALIEPNVRIILCGPEDEALARAVEARGGTMVVQRGNGETALRQVFQLLGIAPPTRSPTGPLVRPSRSGQPAAPVVPSASQRPIAGAVASSPAPTGPLTGETSRRPPEPGSARVTQPDAWVPRGGSQVIRPQQVTLIQTLLVSLAAETSAGCVLLGDAAGMRLVEVGAVPPAFGPVVEPLLATSFSTAGQLARLLKEPEARSLYMHEGVHYDIYAFNVGQSFILTIVFDKQVNPGQIGAVWVYAKRVIRQLETILER